MVSLTIDRMQERDMIRYVEFPNLCVTMYRLTQDKSEEVRANAKIAVQSIAKVVGIDKCENVLSKEIDELNSNDISKFVKIAREEGSPTRQRQKPP